MTKILGKKREVQIGDRIEMWENGRFSWRTVTKVTRKYIWLEAIAPLTGEPFSVKRHRDIILRDTDYY